MIQTAPNQGENVPGGRGGGGERHATSFKGELGNSRHFFAGFHFCRRMFSQRAPPTGLGRDITQHSHWGVCVYVELP